jgi:hypothetical protein
MKKEFLSDLPTLKRAVYWFMPVVMFALAAIAISDLMAREYRSGLILSICALVMAYQLGIESLVKQSRVYSAIAYGLPALAVLIGLLVAGWKIAAF